jgi:hypothetical protein
MKQFALILALTVGALAARADIVVQQKLQSTEQNGILVLKMKGDKIRTDMPSERLGTISLIQDLTTGDKIFMIPSEKRAKRQPAGNLPIGGESPKLVDTGKAEKVGNYDAEIYTWTNHQDMGGVVWVAQNHPDYPRFKGLMQKLHASQAWQMVRTTQPDLSLLPGMVVKSKKETPEGELITTIISIKEEPVDAADFQIPADYTIAGPGE